MSFKVYFKSALESFQSSLNPALISLRSCKHEFSIILCSCINSFITSWSDLPIFFFPGKTSHSHQIFYINRCKFSHQTSQIFLPCLVSFYCMFPFTVWHWFHKVQFKWWIRCIRIQFFLPKIIRCFYYNRNWNLFSGSLMVVT